MPKPLKLGLVGAGFVARFHCIGLKQVRGVEVAGITALKGAEALAQSAKEWGLGEPVVYPNIAELARNVDVVALFAPNFARVAMMEELVGAVKAGAVLKGVICEKPLGRTVAEARRLVELARSAALRTAYFENQIFMKPIRAALAQLEPVQKAMGPLSLTAVVRGTRRTARRLVLGPDEAGRRRAQRHGMPQHRGRLVRPDAEGEGITFLQPQSVSAEVALLKWGSRPGKRSC